MHKKEEQYIEVIKANEGIVHKITGLYTDSPDDRKDLYQEILLQGWKGYQNFKGHSSITTWLYKVSLNTALTFRKKEAKRKDETSLEGLEHTVKDNTKTEEYELLYIIIKRMDDVDKMIITLHLDGFKNKEIAELTGMTNNNVTVKLHRIKANIIDQYKKEGDGHI